VIQRAQCNVCTWSGVGDGKDDGLRDMAREHSERTGHDVRVGEPYRRQRHRVVRVQPKRDGLDDLRDMFRF
jgi:hypothetical protein